MKKILAIDAGNTSISFGIISSGRVCRRWNFPTCGVKDKQGLFRLLKEKLWEQKLEAAVFCSVVPTVDADLRKTLIRFFPGRVFQLGNDISVPIVNRYRRPREVGIDRLVNALAAEKLYGSPALVVDFGTAVTVDVVSEKGEYLGGVILPGIEMSLAGLSEKTALLPRITPARVKDILGQRTTESIRSGIFYGYRFMLTGFIDTLKARVSKGSCITVLTGGNTRLAGKIYSGFQFQDQSLTLKGIELVYSLNNK